MMQNLTSIITDFTDLTETAAPANVVAAVFSHILTTSIILRFWTIGASVAPTWNGPGLFLNSLEPGQYMYAISTGHPVVT